MVEHEFEEYLAILRGLLRLRRKQCDAIADELRDHMDVRLEELLAEGVPRERAVQIALEEFGDAAGVGQAFIEVNRTNQRRWAMKVTAGSILGITALAFLTMAFWPEGSASGPNRVMAQGAGSEETPTQPSPQGGDVTPSMEANNAATAAKLNTVLDEFIVVNENLLHVIDRLREECEGVNFLVDRAALEDAGTEFEKEETLGLSKVRLATLLELILKRWDAGYYIHDGIVIITTEYYVAEATEVRVYNVEDLVYSDLNRGSVSTDGALQLSGPMIPSTNSSSSEGRTLATAHQIGGPGRPLEGPPPGYGGAPGGAGEAPGMPGMGRERTGPADRQPQSAEQLRKSELIGAIVAAVDTDSWADWGGVGQIQAFEGLLIVRNHPKAHQGIERLLAQIREARKKPQGADIGPEQAR